MHLKRELKAAEQEKRIAELAAAHASKKRIESRTQQVYPQHLKKPHASKKRIESVAGTRISA